MTDQDSEYNSSDDEDYVPEDLNDAEEQSGDEANESNNEDDIVLSAVKRPNIQLDTLESNLNSCTVTSSENQNDAVDVDAIFASLMEEQDPLLMNSSNLMPSCKVEKRDGPAIIANESGPSISSVSEVPQSGILGSRQTTVIMEVFDFAGDEVKIKREVTLDELRQHENNMQKKEKALKKGPQKRVGLDGALTLLSKKPKMSVLDKSNHDWKTFKEENKLEEELKTFNKGKNGYLNKMDFLMRTDVRQFENEKSIRNARRRQQ